MWPPLHLRTLWLHGAHSHTPCVRWAHLPTSRSAVISLNPPMPGTLLYSQVVGFRTWQLRGPFFWLPYSRTHNTTFQHFQEEGRLSLGMTSQPALLKALYSGRRDKREGRLARPTNEPSKGMDSTALESTQPTSGPKQYPHTTPENSQNPRGDPASATLHKRAQEGLLQLGDETRVALCPKLALY